MDQNLCSLAWLCEIEKAKVNGRRMHFANTEKLYNITVIKKKVIQKYDVAISLMY